MPRKRKKSTQQRKPSLIFTESPVNIQTHIPSPVLCARHPPTAKTVSVYELEDMHWVSPQFRGVASSDGRCGSRRITRQRRKSFAVCTVGGSNTNKENTQHGNLNVIGNKKSKFKKLKFVGDQTTVASIDEEINISCDTETTEDERPVSNAKISDPETSCDDLDPMLRRSMLKRENVKRNKQKQMKVKRTNTLKKVLQSKINLSAISSDSESSCSAIDTQSDSPGTQKQKNPVTKSPVKRLFASQLGLLSPAESKNRSAIDAVEYSYNKHPVLNSSCVSNLEPTDSDPQPVRRSSRIAANLQCLAVETTPISKMIRTLRVLAPDTPDSEKGLTIRQKQLKGVL